jgi:hypothetical protein
MRACAARRCRDFAAMFAAFAVMPRATPLRAAPRGRTNSFRARSRTQEHAFSPRNSQELVDDDFFLTRLARVLLFASCGAGCAAHLLRWTASIGPPAWHRSGRRIGARRRTKVFFTWEDFFSHIRRREADRRDARRILRVARGGDRAGRQPGAPMR